ncbi:MAG: DNA replication/repair protein RecF [Rhodospirillaceae bacterium]|nr:DNA replication/repair protein RecF [Rhodospirillaceae bacterium]|tara:strand:- start:14417 stop:15586 length:1170 start_codon:yes stop_codon:yes gene_type:complete
MAVQRLVLTDFRCYASLRLNIDAPMIALTGANGAGKTNLLEAISLLVPGRGLRSARLTDLARREHGNPNLGQGWAVAATINGIEGHCEVGTGISEDPGTDNPRRSVRINGATATGQSALGERLSALWITPDMQRLFTEGASGRRRFLDRLVFGFDPAHAGRLKAFEKAMRERSRLLQTEVTQGTSADPAWLNVLEETIVEKGVAIAAARIGLIDRLNPACAMGVGPFPSASLALDGVLDGWLSNMPALEAEDRYKAALQESRIEDRAARSAAIGPHRSDLAVTHILKDAPASQCSTGEQKALLISIVLANARLQSLERGACPILLLDEIAAHLDEDRRSALFAEIQALGAQAWMTGTDASLFAPISAHVQHFTVADAVVTESSPDAFAA